MIGISAKTNDVIRATLLSIKVAPRDIQKNIQKYAKADIIPAWREELNAQGATPLQQALLVDTGRATVSNSNVTLKSGGINASVKGGFSTADRSYRAAEFGANRFVTVTYGSVSKLNKPIVVSDRHTQRQFKRFDKGGYVVYPAAIAVIPRVASLWIASVVRTLHDAVEGKLK